eukprot:CAMPEP_0204274388 /NCGR_PEP_ID=MMETSP0468-20130131/25157_1 /ASSEMBLY_ACC=CAM_ASM_000383 /TAXON_ID=2969 /ORGANISM="Oxyrrhis marina" /LENGTH=567 /DNA_ID=CAMNT_0051250591 /DNA_START=123 /DNA_END=1826 /DNA_ORIENTATION=+
MRVASVLIAVASSRGLRRDVDNTINSGQGADMGTGTGTDMDDEQSVGVWIPIHPEEGRTYFYSPSKGISVYTLPRGAAIAAVQTVGQNATENISYPPTLVPLDQRLSCLPHCLWNCTKPVCEQACKPICPVPACETRCPKLGTKAYDGCKVKCGQPNCAMFCPEQEVCPNGTKVMGCPKCSTKCDKPKCVVDCAHADTGCKTVCPDPVCDWDCHKPKDCPKPECKMVCEQPPDCLHGQLGVPVPMQDGWEKTAVSSAHRESTRWETGEWTACSTKCGEGSQHRSVACNSGHDEDCNLRRKPLATRTCEDFRGCEYTIGEWSPCSNRCGPGHKTREVSCDGPKCLQDKPATEEKCVGHQESCDACLVTIWGGKTFEGWEHSFGPGDYTSVELEYRGLKCDDISSLEVFGDYCEMKAYEYGDFNVEHSGWTAKFGHGKYDVAGLEAAGAKNNDISSFKVYRLNKAAVDGAAASRAAAKDAASSAANNANQAAASAKQVNAQANAEANIAAGTAANASSSAQHGLDNINATLPRAGYGVPSIPNLPRLRAGGGAASVAVVLGAVVVGMLA